MSTTSIDEVVDEVFVHPALVYRDDAEYVAGIAPFLLGGLATGEPVAVAVPHRGLELLRDALGASADDVRWVDMSVAGRNPGRILPAVLHAVADAHPDRHVRIVGEPVWPGRSELEYPACVQHEALINDAFRGRLVTILCPYDTALGPAVLADAEATHPVVIEDGVARRSTGYAPDRMVAQANRALAAPADALVFPFDARRLSAARRAAVGEAERAGLDEERLDDFVLAVGELAANSIRHGGGSGVLRVWVDHGTLVAEVGDAGHLADPLIGRRPAAAAQRGGRGLLMVNHFADLVRTHTGPGGTTTRIFLALEPA